MTYRELYETGKSALAAAEVAEAQLDARLLLEFVCGTDRNTLLVHGDREISPEEEARYQAFLEKRADRIPLQQLTGVQDFMGLEFCVDENVLIPRQDTEILVEEVLRRLHDGMRVLDMCTGSGCILISLLRYSNNCTGVGADISEKALETARKNAERLLGVTVKNGTEATLRPDCEGFCSVKFVRGNLFENVWGQFDVIVSNPPYIRTDVLETLMPEVREHEPRLALDGGGDGLLFYREILKESKGYLKKGGMLFFEIGFDQGQAVRRLLEEAGFLEIQVIKDYGGLDRVVYGTLGFEG